MASYIGDKAEISTAALLKAYAKESILSTKKIVFSGVSGKDIYNITAPFENMGKEYIAGRVEGRDLDSGSKIMFFFRQGDTWALDEAVPSLDLEDPTVCFFGGSAIIMGVAPVISPEKKVISYRTIFFKGESISKLERLVDGPMGMKDIRIVPLPNGTTGMFTRPQGAIGGRGRIGFTSIVSVEDLKILKDEDYFKAKLIMENIPEEEWVGVNAVYPLKNGKLGVLAHIANFTEITMKNYYPFTFCFDYSTMEVSGAKIIATRDSLPQGESKTEQLKNVIFPGGLVRKADGTAILYIGAGDAEAYELAIKDPFLEYE